MATAIAPPRRTKQRQRRIPPTPIAARSDLADACEISAEMAALRRKINNLNKRRRMLWLQASRAGATYVQITRACKVSEAVLTREIRQARLEVKDPELAARAPRRRSAPV